VDVSDTQEKYDLAQAQKASVNFLGTVLNSGADPLLRAQADMLDSMEAVVTDWLQRRHDAVMEARRLVARLRGASDPAEMLRAQQEWASGAFQRFAADAAACQSMTMQLVEKSRRWVEQSTEEAAESAPKPVELARAVPKPMRMAAKAE